MQKQKLIAAAEAQHMNHPQYKGHWDGDEWFVAVCERRVETSAGLAFDVGDTTLAKLDEDSRVGNDVMWLTAYSFRTGMDTAVEADAFTQAEVVTNAGGPVESSNALPPVGTHVRLLHAVDRFPHFVVEAGSTGVVTTSDGTPDGLFSVRMDDLIRDPSGRVVTDWDNEVQWVPDTGDDPLRDIEVIPARKLVATFDVSTLTQLEVAALAGYVETQAESNRGDGAEVVYPSVRVEVEVVPEFPPPRRTVEVLVTVEVDADAPADDDDIADEVRGALEVGTCDETPALASGVVTVARKEAAAV